MATKPNYKFDKRQRDLAKKKQQDEKRLKKQAKNDSKDIGAGAAVETAEDAQAASLPIEP